MANEKLSSTDAHAEQTLPSAASQFQEPLFRKVFVGADGLRAGWSLLLYVALLSIFLALAHALSSESAVQRGAQQQILTVSAALRTEWSNAAAVLLATLAMSGIERRSFTRFGLSPQRIGFFFITGLAWGLLFLSLLVFVLRIQGLLVFDGLRLPWGQALRFGALWLLAFLGVGLFEETYFRGYVLATLERGLSGLLRLMNVRAARPLGFWTAAVVLSFGFGMVHASNSGESPIGIFSAGLVSLVFCLSLWRTGSLWWAIGFHCAWDWAQSFLYGVADSGTLIQGHLFGTHPQGTALLSGGVTGPEGSVWVVPVLFATGAVIALTLPKNRYRSEYLQTTVPM